MPPARDFKLTVAARAKRDRKFRQALFTEAISAYLAGDTRTGKAVLRDLVNATVGFEGLAAEVKKPGESLHCMFAPPATRAPKSSSASSGRCRRRPARGCG